MTSWIPKWRRTENLKYQHTNKFVKDDSEYMKIHMFELRKK